MEQVEILIAEDNSVNAYVIGKILERGGFHYAVAVDGVEAVEMALLHKPKIALLDINMPRMNGIDAAKEMQERMAQDCPIIIAVTASDTPAQREECRQAGFNHFIAKPIRKEGIIQLLRRLIEFRLIDISEDSLVAMSY